jgi:hypothetical protein
MSRLYYRATAVLNVYLLHHFERGLTKPLPAIYETLMNQVATFLAGNGGQLQDAFKNFIDGLYLGAKLEPLANESKFYGIFAKEYMKLFRRHMKDSPARIARARLRSFLEW